jgi:capsular polysaccharide biosynthesis protein
MELIAIMRVLLRRWYMVVIPVLVAGVLVIPRFLGGGSAVSGGYTTTFRYTAAQSLDAIPNRDGDFQDVWLASEFTVNAFTDWVGSIRFAEDVSGELRALGIEIPSTALLGNIITDNDRSIGMITIKWPDMAQLQEIALSVINVLRTRNGDYFPQLGGQPARVELLDDLIISLDAPSLPSRFGPLLQVGVALLAGVLLAFLVDYLDPFLYRREQIEALKLTVIATVPPES